MESQKELIYSSKWDVMVILDACRYDYFEKIALPLLRQRRFNIIDYKKVYSLGGCTQEWFFNTFTEPLMDTIYISGNPYIRNGEVIAYDGKTRYNPSKLFSFVEDAWDRCWRQVNQVHTVDPNCLTILARTWAIRSFKLGENKRLIVHYMQPHAPYPHEPSLRQYFANNKNTPDWNMWIALREGRISKEHVAKGYTSNLSWVLRSVIRLLRTINDKIVVITSDHGELFGEHGYYNHPCGVNVDLLRNVPWLVVRV